MEKMFHVAFKVKFQFTVREREIKTTITLRGFCFICLFVYLLLDKEGRDIRRRTQIDLITNLNPVFSVKVPLW